MIIILCTLHNHGTYIVYYVDHVTVSVHIMLRTDLRTELDEVLTNEIMVNYNL